MLALELNEKFPIEGHSEMPREILLRMRLTNHMVYDCAPQDEVSGVHSDNPEVAAEFSLEPPHEDRLESASKETNEQESDQDATED